MSAATTMLHVAPLTRSMCCIKKNTCFAGQKQERENRKHTGFLALLSIYAINGHDRNPKARFVLYNRLTLMSFSRWSVQEMLLKGTLYHATVGGEHDPVASSSSSSLVHVRPSSSLL
jgi:hypothetical protein